MSYHLTILRSTQGEEVPITLDQAIAAVQALGDWRYTASPPTFEHLGTEGTSVLWHQDGQLWSRNPEAWAFEPMLALARQLSARLRGDEFETYESVDKTYFHPDDVHVRKQAEAASRAMRSASMREQRLIRNVIVACFLGLGAVGFAVGTWFEMRPH